MHTHIIGYAQKEKIETVRIDSTAVKTDIHHPTDSTLLADGIRVITRWLIEGKELVPIPSYLFSDHRRVVKERILTILNARKDTVHLHSGSPDKVWYFEHHVLPVETTACHGGQHQFCPGTKDL
ncbi:MAG: hypothetical protein A4E59_02485 [Syntrophorhabdus sp. PtaB.Bin027]|nr:MAG: hypothetical protein A4E59_02485 [Syntrophorhabdus sp. PtaB.Bin027]OQB77929.1 MAG: hypothetical protein BWX92_00571 [Deltaproteobacteria bacterium ADurb.Bin135]